MEEEKERIVQYAVTVKNSDFPYKRYVWAPEKAIKDIFDRPVLNKEIPKNIIYVGHISECRGDEVSFDRRYTGSLEILAETQESAKKIIEYLNIPLTKS